jgi:hypothetical protein
MAIDSAPLANGHWSEALIYVALFGFIGSFIFGVSARAIRGFLLLKPMHETINIVALWLVQIGLTILVIGDLLISIKMLLQLGSSSVPLESLYTCTPSGFSNRLADRHAGSQLATSDTAGSFGLPTAGSLLVA